MRSDGGIYKHIKMSLKTADLLVAVLAAALIIVTAVLVANGGFTVEFQSNGGTAVEPKKVMHGETLEGIDDPTRQGFTFAGWFKDPDCTQEWDTATDTVTDSVTLYAKWE